MLFPNFLTTTSERIYWLPLCYNFVNSSGKQEYHSLNILLDQPPYLQSTEQVPFFSHAYVFTDQISTDLKLMCPTQIQTPFASFFFKHSKANVKSTGNKAVPVSDH